MKKNYNFTLDWWNGFKFVLSVNLCIPALKNYYCFEEFFNSFIMTESLSNMACWMQWNKWYSEDEVSGEYTAFGKKKKINSSAMAIWCVIFVRHENKLSTFFCLRKTSFPMNHSKKANCSLKSRLVTVYPMARNL